MEKIQKHHELEKKLFEAKIKQAEAVLVESSEKNNKERNVVRALLNEGLSVACSHGMLKQFSVKYKQIQNEIASIKFVKYGISEMIA